LQADDQPVDDSKIVGDSLCPQDLFIEVIRSEWYGVVDTSNSMAKVILAILFPIYTPFHGKPRARSGDEHPSFGQRFISPFMLQIDSSELQRTVAPTISYTPDSRRITLRTPTKGATIYFTTDARKSAKDDGDVYHPKRHRRAQAKETAAAVAAAVAATSGGGGRAAAKLRESMQYEQQATVIELPKSGLLTIKAIAKRKGLHDSVETVKTVNCEMEDMVLGAIPPFSKGR
jgi:hypothetical protein